MLQFPFHKGNTISSEWDLIPKYIEDLDMLWMLQKNSLNCILQVLPWRYKEQKHLKLGALTWISGMHLKLLLWVPCLQEEQISPGIFFPQWSCCLLAGASTQGAGWSKTSWSQQGCNHQDDEVRGNLSASSVETGACGTLTDLSLCTCVINCIHNFLLSKHFVGFVFEYSVLHNVHPSYWWLMNGQEQ